MQIKIGQRLRSTVCATEIIVVRAGTASIDLTCGGSSMVELDAPGSATEGGPLPGFDTGTQVGKRYVDPAGHLEVLVTKPGEGALAAGPDLLLVKEAKSLPSSD